jgi:hypothetical protein
LGSGVPPSVRSTGITERLMDLIVICDPLPPRPRHHHGSPRHPQNHLHLPPERSPFARQ